MHEIVVYGREGGVACARDSSIRREVWPVHEILVVYGREVWPVHEILVVYRREVWPVHEILVVYRREGVQWPVHEILVVYGRGGSLVYSTAAPWIDIYI